MKAEIINQPYSGEFEERIYDVESAWNSQSWTWIKFTDDDGIEKVGQFRGFPKKVKVSNQKGEVIILTSDCAFRLDTNKLNIIESEKQVDYGNLEVTSKGTFILSEYGNIYRLESSLSDMQIIESSFELDWIEFKKWNGDILEFECSELTNYERIEIMELNTNDWSIKTKKTTPQHRV